MGHITPPKLAHGSEFPEARWVDGGGSIMGGVMVYVPPSHMTPQGSGRPNGGSYKGGGCDILFFG